MPSNRPGGLPVVRLAERDLGEVGAVGVQTLLARTGRSWAQWPLNISREADQGYGGRAGRWQHARGLRRTSRSGLTGVFELDVGA